MARFCLACGRELTAAAKPREERRVVSVIFVDLVGFTERSEQLDPEDVKALVAPYHARVRAELERHGVGEAIPVVLGGIVPDADVDTLRDLGVRAVFTPKDFDLLSVMDRILDVIGAPASETAARAASA